MKNEELQEDTYSVNKFCKAHNISRGTFYNLRKQGKGPKVITLGRLVLISKEAAAEWRKNMEK